MKLGKLSLTCLVCVLFGAGALAVSLITSACSPGSDSPDALDDDDSSGDDDDDNDDSSDDDDDNDDADTGSSTTWYGCADMEDCQYLCLFEVTCVADCEDRMVEDSVPIWQSYQQCIADHCAEFAQDSKPYTECMNEHCLDEKQACAENRGQDPDYAQVGPDSNEPGEVATNVFWYGADDSLLNFRDHFYRQKKAIILEVGAVW